MLRVVYAECRKQTHSTECRYAECRGARLSRPQGELGLFERSMKWQVDKMIECQNLVVQLNEKNV
jgi:hypothetical protein